MLVTVSCNGDQPTQTSSQESQPTKIFLTPTQPAAGSAKLYYQLVTKNPPFFTAVETDVIPLDWKFDPDHPKEIQEMLTGNITGSFFVQIAANNEGQTCFFWFDIPVEIDVWGNYKPDPVCGFDISLITKAKPPVTVRGQNCGPAAETLLKQYPAEVLFIPAPEKVYAIPGDLTVTIPIDELTTITLTITDVVVPEATGCQWGEVED